MAKIESRLIENAAASVGLEFQLKQSLGIPMGVKPRFLVFETTVGKKTVYCCWSGGELRDGEVFFTPIGNAACQVLAALPVGSKTLIMQELKPGQTPIPVKVARTLRKAPREAKVVFFGDMAGELDGEMDKSLNLVGTVEI